MPVLFQTLNSECCIRILINKIIIIELLSTHVDSSEEALNEPVQKTLNKQTEEVDDGI